MKTITIIIMCLILAGCATGYHKQGWTGGFSESQYQEDVFRVSFKGNAYTSKEKVNDYLMLRCAEVTLERGYDYFVILDEESYTKNSTYTTPVQANTHGNISSSPQYYSSSPTGGVISGTTASYNARTTYSGGQTFNISKPRSNFMFKCFKGVKPSDMPNAFVAHELIGFLKNKIK